MINVKMILSYSEPISQIVIIYIYLSTLSMATLSQSNNSLYTTMLSKPLAIIIPKE